MDFHLVYGESVGAASGLTNNEPAGATSVGSDREEGGRVLVRSNAGSRWSFLVSPSTDGVWYIGSSLAGFVYVALVLLLGRDSSDPMNEPFYRLSLGSSRYPLTLGLLVVGSWALFIDAPHVWATLARTFLDPDDWRDRKRMLVGSTIWFFVGPLAILGPYLLGAFVPMTPATLALPAVTFFVLFRLWAYYHVVRQHWGFLVLYKRKNDDWSDAAENRADHWFFNAALYLPLLLFLTAPWYRETGMPELGLSRPLFHGQTAASMLRPVFLALYPMAIAAYCVFQIARYRSGVVRNGPKLLFLAAIVPLHLAVFSHPLLALFVVPIVTVGHNLQYHRIVWSFGRSKYGTRSGPSYRWARAAFRSVPAYLGLGLAFSFFLYQGPLIETVKPLIARAFDEWLFAGLGLLAGLTRPEEARIGARVVSALFLGWAMQHYYLDSKIWRVHRDPALAHHLEGVPKGLAESSIEP
jgi:hypothetical protein